MLLLWYDRELIVFAQVLPFKKVRGKVEGNPFPRRCTKQRRKFPLSTPHLMRQRTEILQLSENGDNIEGSRYGHELAAVELLLVFE